MLYVFHGTDIPKSIEKAHHLIDSLRAKKPDAAYAIIDPDHWSSSVIEEHLGGQGLFSNKYIIFVDRITENVEAKEVIADFIAAMNESANIFIMLEGKVLTDLKKAIDKSAEKVVVSDLAEKKAQEGFNVFALAGSLGSGDAVKTWSMYRQSVDAGNEPESTIGMLFWKVKTMILKGDRNYSAAEAKSLLEKLVTLYHDGHRGMVNLELGVEQLLLTSK